MTDLPALLHEFYRDKLAEMLRHIAGARLITQYDANNTYQYVINREETQLSWVGQSILELGGGVDSSGVEPERKPAGKGAVVANTILDEDIGTAQAFLDRWRPRVEGMSDAHNRQRNMLNVVRKGIQEAGLLQAVGTLAQHELHALFMILDPKAQWRNSRGVEIEKKLKDAFDSAAPKVISGSVSLIDAQEAILTAVIEALDAARKDQPPKGPKK